MRINRILTLAVTTIMLTAQLGRVTWNGHCETWYNLPMEKILAYRQSEGYEIDYWERKDGMKMNGRFIIVAASEDIPIGTIVETSRGLGIVFDRHETDSNVFDLATTW